MRWGHTGAILKMSRGHTCTIWKLSRGLLWQFKNYATIMAHADGSRVLPKYLKGTTSVLS